MVEQNALIVNGLNVPYTVATGQGTIELCIKDANVDGTVWKPSVS